MKYSSQMLKMSYIHTFQVLLRSDVVLCEDWFLYPPSVALCTFACRVRRPYSPVSATAMFFENHIN